MYFVTSNKSVINSNLAKHPLFVVVVVLFFLQVKVKTLALEKPCSRNDVE